MNRLALIIAGIAAALSAAGSYFYLERVETELSGGRRVALLSLLKPLKPGELLDETALATRLVPMAYAESRAIRASQKGRIIGLPVRAELRAQQTLQWSDIALGGGGSRELSSMIRPGRRAMAIRARRGTDFSLIRPGDYVDVIGDFADPGGQPRSVVLLQRILVLAVGQDVGNQDGSAEGPWANHASMTLSVPLGEAQLVSVALGQGGVSVVLRNPNDQELLLDMPDVPASALFDPKARARVQARSHSPHLPVRLETAQ